MCQPKLEFPLFFGTMSSSHLFFFSFPPVYLYISAFLPSFSPFLSCEVPSLLACVYSIRLFVFSTFRIGWPTLPAVLAMYTPVCGFGVTQVRLSSGPYQYLIDYTFFETGDMPPYRWPSTSSPSYCIVIATSTLSRS